MSLTKTYYGCNGSTLTPVVVTMSSGASWQTTSTIYGCALDNTNRYITLSIPSALTDELRVFYNFYSKSTKNGVITYEGTRELSYSIPAGSTFAQFLIAETASYICTGGDTIISESHVTALNDQASLPTSCNTQPSGCTLNITSIVPTIPSSRGASDGKIKVYITGSDGYPTFWLNNVSGATGPFNTYTFTGLNSGYYSLRVTDPSNCFDIVNDYYLADGQFSTGIMRKTEPVKITAANSPVVLTLETAQNSDSPRPSKGNFRIVGTVANDDSITFRLTYPQDYTATFTAKGYPDSNKYFLASVLTDENGNTVGSNTANEIATSLAEALQQDTVINRLYYITNSSNYVNLIARENNPYLDLNVNKITIDAAKIQLNTTQYGICEYDGQLTSDYSIYAEVYVNPALEFGAVSNENDYIRAGELQLPYQLDNIHKFQINEIVKNYMSTNIIDLNASGFTTIPNYDCAYFVKYGEMFPLITNSNTKKKRYKSKISARTMCNAAFDWEEANDMSIYLGDSISDLNPNFIYAGTYGSIEFTDLITATGVTGLQTAIYNLANDTLVDGWYDSGHTYTGLTDGTYIVRVSGTTGIYPYTVEKRLNYNSSALAIGYGFYNSPVTLLPRTNISWLTNSPSPLYIQRNSSQWLSFLLERGYASATRTLYLKGNLYYYNGNSTTGITFFNITTTSQTNFGGMTVLSCGYQQMGLAAYENSGNTKIRKAEFAVWQSDTLLGEIQLTETKTYLFEIDEAPTKYGTVFLNKLGTWDTFDFVGEIIYDEDVTRETYQVPRVINSDGSSPKGFEANSVYNTQYTRKVTVNSGTIDEDTYVWLQEMLQSNKIYCYTDVNTPFLITDGFISNKSTNSSEFTMQISFRETLYDNNVNV